MDHERTRSLYAPLITKPALTDQLLNRPPFKFLLDVFSNTISKTGFLKDTIPTDQLDVAKLTDKSAKAAILDRIIEAVNDDGSLDDVKSAKILAGKEPELTNKLLQKFAQLATGGGKSSGSVKRERSKSKDKKEKSNGEREEKKKHKDKDDKEKKEKKDKDKDEKKEKKHKDKDKDERKKEKDKDKEKKEKSKDKKHKDKEGKEKEKEKEKKERRTSISHNPGVDSMTLEGGDDDDDHHLSNGYTNGHGPPKENGFRDQEDALSPPREIAEDSQRESPRPPPPEERERLLRQSTGAARPQTSMGRPGTAAARAAPPKLKKKQIATTSETRVVENTDAISEIILDGTKETTDKNEETFIEDSEDFIMPDFKEEEEVPENEDERGGLVNKIIGTRTEMEETALEGEAVIDDKDDDGEQAKHRIQVNQLQEDLQKITRTAFPLARLFDYAQEDFDSMIRELDKWRMESRKYEQQVNDAKAQSNFDSHQEAARLKSLNEEIRETRAKLIALKARITENDENIRIIIANM